MNRVSEGQVGGTHYKDMAISPIEFAMRNNWDACAFSILKHVSRHRAKAGLQDIQKAQHYVKLRVDLWGPWLYPARPADKIITASAYCDSNRLDWHERRILVCLEEWIEDSAKAVKMVAAINDSLDALAHDYA